MFEPDKIAGATGWARAEAREKSVPAIVEVITEKVTNIAMGTDIDKITEFEEVIDLERYPIKPHWCDST